jgi:hypothetical protein
VTGAPTRPSRWTATRPSSGSTTRAASPCAPSATAPRWASRSRAGAGRRRGVAGGHH